MPKNAHKLFRLIAALPLLLMTPVFAAEERVVKLTPAQIKTAGITLAQPRPAADNRTGNTLRLTGRVSIPNRGVELVSALVAGQVQSVLVNVGETVRPGTPLARVYSADWIAQQRTYLHAVAEADMTRQKLARDEMLLQDGIIAQSRLEETRAAHAMARATLNEQQQLLKLAGLDKAQIAKLQSAAAIDTVLTVVASMHGVVLEQNVTPGTRVEPGAPLFKLANASTLWVELQASQEQVGQLRIGDPAVAVTCNKGGKIVAISPQVEVASQTALVRTEFDDAGACLRPNQYVEVDIDAKATQDVVAIPVSALVRSAGKDWVFVQTGNGFKLQPVTVQARQRDQAWIKNTLGAQAQVAVSGIAALRGAAAGLGMNTAVEE